MYRILVVAATLSLLSTQADAAKKPKIGKPAAAKPAKTPKAAKPGKPAPVVLDAGVECELKGPVAATTQVGKKTKKVKLAKGARVSVLSVGPLVSMSSDQGIVSAKRALITKQCKPVEAAPAEEADDEEAPPLAAPVATTNVASATPEEPASAPVTTPAEAPSEAASQPVSSDAPIAIDEGNVTPATVDPEPAALAPVVDEERVAKAKKARTMRALAITFTAVGAVGLATGGTFLTLALLGDAQLSRDIAAFNTQEVRTEAQRQALVDRQNGLQTYYTVGIIAGAVGAAALTTGIVLFAVGDKPSDYEDVASLRLMPTFAVGRESAYFGLSGSF